MSRHGMAVGESARPLWWRLGPLYCLALTGLWPLAARIGQDVARLDPAHPFAGQPATMIAVVLAQTATLLLLACLIGATLAHRVGLVSVLAHRLGFARFQAELPLAIVLGAALGVLLAALDHWIFMPRLAFPDAALVASGDSALQALALGLLYGGISEEIMMRWGLMTLICWGCARCARPSPAIMPHWIAWTGILLSAAVFAFGHLPVAAQSGGLDGLMAVRLLSLNTLAGIVFGWLYWRRSLEAACVAHAVVHVCFWGLA